MTRILVADDHPLFREALSGALEPYFENAQIIQAGSLDDALEKLNEFDGVDLVLLDPVSYTHLTLPTNREV